MQRDRERSGITGQPGRDEQRSQALVEAVSERRQHSRGARTGATGRRESQLQVDLGLVLGVTFHLRLGVLGEQVGVDAVHVTDDQVGFQAETGSVMQAAVRDDDSARPLDDAPYERGRRQLARRDDQRDPAAFVGTGILARGRPHVGTFTPENECHAVLGTSSAKLAPFTGSTGSSLAWPIHLTSVPHAGTGRSSRRARPSRTPPLTVAAAERSEAPAASNLTSSVRRRSAWPRVGAPAPSATRVASAPSHTFSCPRKRAVQGSAGAASTSPAVPT